MSDPTYLDIPDFLRNQDNLKAERKAVSGGTLTMEQAYKAVSVALQRRITELEKQLAERDKEIERMLPVVAASSEWKINADVSYSGTTKNSGVLCKSIPALKLWNAVYVFESTKPAAGGTET